MDNANDRLRRAARQLIETDLLLGADSLPKERNPLPAARPRSTSAPASAAAGTGSAPPAPKDKGGLSAGQKKERLDRIDQQEVRSCIKCRLCEGRRQTVFGEGSADADLVFIGEGPGEEEDRQGLPFVGRAGQKLNEMIAAMGLRRQDAYITNVVKCRPPGNRAPLPDEAAACHDYLLRQLEIIRPRVIVTLGNPATQALLDTKVGITRLRGAWQGLTWLGELAGTPVMPTFHPAYLLRQYTPDNRRKVWEDLQKVMELLGLKK